MRQAFGRLRLEAGRKAESTKSLTEPTKCSEKKQLYSVTSHRGVGPPYGPEAENSARDKKVILTADTHRHTRTGRYKAGKVKEEQGIELRAQGVRSKEKNSAPL